MIDTFKLANRLSGAGMDRGIRETLAEELNDRLRAEVATRSDLDALFWRTMAGVAVLLAGPLAAVWGLIAAHTGGWRPQANPSADSGAPRHTVWRRRAIA